MTVSLLATGDFNCQLRRNVPGYTDRWVMTRNTETQGHGQEILELIRNNDLFAVDTKFKPKVKTWSARKRQCDQCDSTHLFLPDSYQKSTGFLQKILSSLLSNTGF